MVLEVEVFQHPDNQMASLRVFGFQRFQHVDLIFGCHTILEKMNLRTRSFNLTNK